MTNISIRIILSSDFEEFLELAFPTEPVMMKSTSMTNWGRDVNKAVKKSWPPYLDYHFWSRTDPRINIEELCLTFESLPWPEFTTVLNPISRLFPQHTSKWKEMKRKEKKILYPLTNTLVTLVYFQSYLSTLIYHEHIDIISSNRKKIDPAFCRSIKMKVYPSFSFILCDISDAIMFHPTKPFWLREKSARKAWEEYMYLIYLSQRTRSGFTKRIYASKFPCHVSFLGWSTRTRPTESQMSLFEEILTSKWNVVPVPEVGISP